MQLLYLPFIFRSLFKASIIMVVTAQSAEAVEYADYTTAEG